MTRPAPFIVGIAAALLLLLAAYMGAYYLAINPLVSRLGFDAPSQTLWVEPTYRIEGLDHCFWPAYQVDRQLRPERWK
jgi:hypothetical protein